MGIKSSKPEDQQADVETGQLGSNVEVTAGIEAEQYSVVPPGYSLLQPEGTDYVTYSQAHPPYNLAQPQGMMYITYSQQHHQEQNEDSCCVNWKWWHWLLFIITLPFTIAFFVIFLVIYIFCWRFGVDLLKCENS